MKNMKLILLMLVILFAPIVLMAAEEEPSLPLTPEHQQWLDVVHWIISDYEKTAFLSLKDNEDRDRFIAAFWENRDPTPGTEANEFKAEHMKRFEHAKKQFGRETTIPGWKTDRGKVYILLGKPEFIKRNPSPFEFYPMELWQYAGYEGYGLPGSLYFLFFQEKGVGPYRLYSPLQDGIKSLFIQQSNVVMKTEEDLFDYMQTQVDPDLAHAALSSIPTEGGDPSAFINTGSITAEMIQAKLQNARNYDLPKRKYVESFIRDLPHVQVYTSLDSGGIYDSIFWFRAPNGNYYMDYAVEFEPNKLDMGQYIEEFYTSLSIDGTVSTPDNKEVDEIVSSHEIKLTQAQFNKIQSLPFQYQGRRPIVPGKFGITLIMNNNVSRRSITFTHDLEVPDTSKLKAPVFSPLLPLRVVENAQEDDKKVRPFQFGDKLLTPNLSGRFSNKGNLQVYHQLVFPDTYVPGLGDMSLHYIVRQGEKIETEVSEPVNLPLTELAGAAIDARKEIPLTALTLGAKELIVELRQDDKVVSRSEALSFSVEGDAIPGAWKFAVAIPSFDNVYHSYALAQQHLKLNQAREAVALLEDAYKKNPDSPQVRLQLMRVALKSNQFQKVLDLGLPLEVKTPRDKQLLWLLGWSYYGLQKYDEASRFFERLRIEDPKKVEVFNLLADIYFRMDQPQKSLERVEQSLALNPDQKDIQELKRKLQSGKTQ